MTPSPQWTKDEQEAFDVLDNLTTNHPVPIIAAVHAKVLARSLRAAKAEADALRKERDDKTELADVLRAQNESYWESVQLLPDLRREVAELRDQLAAARELIGDYREGIDRDGTVAWSKEEASAWYGAAGDFLAPPEPRQRAEPSTLDQEKP